MTERAIDNIGNLAIRRWIEADPKYQDLSYMVDFWQAFGHNSGWMAYEPGRVGQLLTDAEVDLLSQYLQRVREFVEAADCHRRKLHVIPGGRL